MSNNEKEDYVVIGKIVNTHAVKGELRVLPLTDFPERFFLCKPVYVGEKKECLEIESARWHKNIIIVKLMKINDLDSAQTLKDKFVYTTLKEVMPLPEGNFYVFDIVGLTVFDTDDCFLGVVKDVLQTGSNDVYVVEKEMLFEENLKKKKNKKIQTLLVPALRTVVKSIDLSSKKIIIMPLRTWMSREDCL